MEFMPAEEYSDEDSADGFFDEDHYSENCNLKYKYQVEKQNEININVLSTEVKPKCSKPHPQTTCHNGQQQNDKNRINNKLSLEDPEVPTNLLHLNSNHNTAPDFNQKQAIWKSTFVRHDASHPCFSETNVFTKDDFKKAAVKGNVSVLQQCLSQDLAFDAPFKGGWTALMYAANYAQPDVVQLLITKGANVNYHFDFFTPLMAACSASESEKEENVTKCVQLLIEAGADINVQDRLHITSLMLASREGHAKVVDILIKHGVEVNKQDGRGWTALTWAVQRGKKDVVRYLLSSGADPDIQHQDKLTVKNLAASLPTSEMLDLLEHEDTTQESKKSAVGTTLDLSIPQSKFDDLKMFLCGLDLPHLVCLFQQQLVDLSVLMTLTEQDLVQMGVDQVGARKKILDAVHAIHKKDWQQSSLVSFNYNKKLSCADVIAIMANSSRQIRYLNSSTVYIKGQLKSHPELVTQPTDQVSPLLFNRHIEDTLKNVKVLNEQLLKLQLELNQEMKHRCLEPADLVKGNGFKHRRRKQLMFIFTLCVCVAVPLYYYRNSLLTFWPFNVSYS
ncbi:ankyrin repeat, SAM and basic leucine zipper domain-containing protein 1-like [Biomphalaria glabrata]|uniref:Ankyrin repeat, SAM and basic leucine zipper domain-containing protein 1 n=1 Tax=Biomphalaria glabrata TaxID=6526 RepID=A0A9W3AAI8_BIOGL|nr:ankyrin repeat, SAM and basic leucine zipper domain-containing protein 1-like [Biomphalaria glabrata]XP_055884168.1 ankyrin repeat, SAM and basic leucine zipper domain-containing protein 1-like [Biomphalaria glabrata]XP_055884169.1 ankyrin repeat, SAM and basic leucine zipper domain-containing protein 1-like [Biomphalaria glabrata]XP_055884170.1 ankyrin repeat, SAM and basic leucine zipper domain-containing protein 1-like [Biomphalaria glabrata]